MQLNRAGNKTCCSERDWKEGRVVLKKSALKTVLLMVCAVALCTSCATLGGGPAPEGVGYVTSDYEQYSAQLISNTGRRLNLRGGADRVEVPVGEYSLAACTFVDKDDEGARWQIVGKSEPVRSVLEVSQSKTTALTFGPPLTASLAVEQVGDALTLGLMVRGQSGEIYSPAEFTQNGRQPAPPLFEIRDGRGEIIARGQFHYG
jgi:hypothetical protein